MKVLFFYKNNESLGLEYLSAALKERGHDTFLLFDPSADNFGVRFLDRASGFRWERARDAFRLFRPDLVCFSLLTNHFWWGLLLARRLKAEFDVPVLAGGPHPTIVPEFVASKPEFDYACVGEGEQCIVRLVEVLEQAGWSAGERREPSDHDWTLVPGLPTVPNLAFRAGGKGDVTINPLAPLITDLDALPFPDKDLFFDVAKFTDPYHVVATRGCPHDCTYCINHQLHALYPGQPRVRRRSVENVVAELEWAQRRYGLRSVYFQDDNFLLDGKWLRRFALEYRRRVDLPFKCLAHPASVDRKVAKLLWAAGCRDVDLGVESGSSRIREAVFGRARVENRRILAGAKALMDVGVRLTTLNIVNAPTETPADLRATLELNAAINPHAVHLTSLYPYPNTRVAQACADADVFPPAARVRVLYGLANYRQRTLLDHPNADLGERIRLYAPLLLRLPRWLQRRFLRVVTRLPPVKALNAMNVALSTSFHNGLKKLRELLSMTRSTRRFYAHLKRSARSLN